MRESLKIMSLSDFSYSLSMFLSQAVFALVAGLLLGLGMLGDLDTFPDAPYGNSLLFGLAVLLYSLAMIAFCMALTTLFDDPILADQAGGLLLLIPQFLFLSFSQQAGGGKYWIYAMYPLPVIPAVVLFVDLSNNNAEEFKMYNLVSVEHLDIPFTWAWLIVLTPLWLLIFVYLENVLPSAWGSRRSCCFCCSKAKKVKMDDEVSGSVQGDSVALLGLPKAFGKFTAVNDLSFAIRQGEVFTFLGHNGAGKTTTIYMLTGMLAPTKGTALVYGQDIRKELKEVQQNIGLCQQFDVLFDQLTVQEHLELVCEIKGVSDIESTIEETLKMVILTEFRDKRVKELSGGMKRKLSLAMAIVGKPKLIILDEPTSGLDVESRKQIWELIKNIKQECCIIMSSQHLEEADELSDRICIMTKGQLLSLDTPQKIK